MDSQRYGTQCAAPPHPDLLARMQTNLLKVQGTEGQQSIRKLTHSLVAQDRTGHMSGLNDGMIFPHSHFNKSVSTSTISRAALDRKPLRGAIK